MVRRPLFEAVGAERVDHTPRMTWVRSDSSCAALRSWDCFLHWIRVSPCSGQGMEQGVGALTSSSPLHLWSSRRRCLPQKWPWQKEQSPTMRWAGSLHSFAEHRRRLPAMREGSRGALAGGGLAGAGVGVVSADEAAVTHGCGRRGQGSRGRCCSNKMGDGEQEKKKGRRKQVRIEIDGTGREVKCVSWMG